MFTPLLLPMDGFELCEIAIRNGIQFAKEINARVTGFHVLPEFHVFTYRPEMLEETREEFTRDAGKRGGNTSA